MIQLYCDDLIFFFQRDEVGNLTRTMIVNHRIKVVAVQVFFEK